MDLTSGTGVFLGRISQPSYASLSWDFDSSDKLYYAGHPTINDEWATIDLAAFTATQIGNTGIRIRGLSFLDDVNEPPTADAGPDQTVECTSTDGSTVTLDGSGSGDPDGDALTYTWKDSNGGTIATGVSPAIALPRHPHDHARSERR